MDGDAAKRCVASSQANAVAFTPLGCVHLIHWQTIQGHLIALATPCVDDDTNNDDDTLVWMMGIPGFAVELIQNEKVIATIVTEEDGLYTFDMTTLHTL